MSVVSPEKSDEAKRADRFFEKHIRPVLDDDTDPRAYVAIDVDTEDFEVHRRQYEAGSRLLERHPEAEGRLWFRRVGSPVAHHIGGRTHESYAG